MVSCNIKGSKKAIAFEGPLVLFCIAIGIVVLLFIYWYSHLIGSSFEDESIRTTTEFPSLYVRTFIDEKVTITEAERVKIGLEPKSEYRVKDILAYDNDEAKSKITELKGDYISWSYKTDKSGEKTMHDYYSNLVKVSYSQSDLLYIQYGVKDDIDLTRVLARNNSVYLVRDVKGTYTAVYFRKENKDWYADAITNAQTATVS